MGKGEPRKGSERSGTYDRDFYLDQAATSSQSAEAVVPILQDAFGPQSVVDIGCGIGTWLEVFDKFGVGDTIGIDGSGGKTELLRIPTENFVEHDLTQPIDLGRTFDLAISLEVAEHLPAEMAAAFVATLVSLAPVVAFSAAVPGQGGTGHINEQWQSYWAALFEDHGYSPIDLVRPAVWSNSTVTAHYAQNILVYVRDSDAQNYGLDPRASAPLMLDMVHPTIFRRKTTHPILVSLSQKIPEKTKNSLTRRLRGTPLFDRL